MTEGMVRRVLKVMVAACLVLWLCPGAAPAGGPGPADTYFSVLSFNVWGLAGAKIREARMEEIGHEAAALSPDLVVFVEAFEEPHRKILVESMKRAGYPVRSVCWHQWPPGGYGSGIMLVSRYEMVDDHYLAFQVPGNDKLGKGMAITRVRTPRGEIALIGLHALARSWPYRMGGRVVENDPKKAERLLQFYEISEAMTAAVTGDNAASAVIVAGDFNVPPELLEYKLLLALTGAYNSFDCLHPGQNPSTFDSRTDNWASINLGRIDHVIFLNNPDRSVAGPRLRPVEARPAMTDKFDPGNGRPVNLSDHYAIYARFCLAADPGQDYQGPSWGQRPWPSEARGPISGQDRQRLIAELRSGPSAGTDDAVLFTKLGMDLLARSDESGLYKSRPVKAAAKLLVGTCLGESRPLDWRERSALIEDLDRERRSGVGGGGRD